MGHFPFSQQLFPFNDRRFVALFREPIQRCISYYHHVMSRDEWLGRQVSLAEYIENSSDIQLNNHQTRLLAGMKQHPITEKHLDSAIRNIEKNFLHIGILDRFPESIEHLASLLGWSNKKILRENVTPQKQAVSDDFADDVLQMLRDCNEYDIKLYDHVTSRLE